MSSINNFKGHIVGDGKVVYSEKLTENIFFIVSLKYEPKFSNGYCNESSALTCEAFISNGSKHQYGNGTISFEDSKYVEEIELTAMFKELNCLYTKAGYKCEEKPHTIENFEYNGVKMKRRTVKWTVIVPKEELLKFCLL